MLATLKTTWTMQRRPRKKQWLTEEEDFGYILSEEEWSDWGSGEEADEDNWDDIVQGAEGGIWDPKTARMASRTNLECTDLRRCKGSYFCFFGLCFIGMSPEAILSLIE